MDRIQEQKLKLATLLSNSNTAVSCNMGQTNNPNPNNFMMHTSEEYFEDITTISNGNTNSFHKNNSINQQQPTFFVDKVQRHVDLDIRSMGPKATNKSISSENSYIGSSTNNQKILMSNLNKQIGSISLNDWSPASLSGQIKTPSELHHLNQGYNPIIGSAYSPFNTKPFLSAAQPQFGSNEINHATAAALLNATTSQSQTQFGSSGISSINQHTMISSASLQLDVKQQLNPLVDKFGSLAGLETSNDESLSSAPSPSNTTHQQTSVNLSPNSIKSKLSSILDASQIEQFLSKYKDVSDESTLLFLANTMKFDSCFDF
jgi:hypothetical protein